MLNLNKQLKELSTTLIAGFITALFSLVISTDIFFSIGPISDLKLKFIDDRFEARGKLDTGVVGSTDVVIVEIREESYLDIPPPYNSWPWPRDLFAKVIENLNEAGAAAVGIDIVMDLDDAFDVKNDSLLFDTIKKFKNVVVAGQIDDTRSVSFIPGPSSRGKANQRYLKEDENYGNIFFGADSSIGIVQVSYDEDGVARRYFPYITSFLEQITINGKTYLTEKKLPSFGFALLNKYFNKKSLYVADNYAGYFDYNEINIPKINDYSYLINFYGTNITDHFHTEDFINVLDDEAFDTALEIETGVEINYWNDPELMDQSVFKDKIVIIGSTDEAFKDLVNISVSQNDRDGANQIYGVYFHANAIENVLDGKVLTVQSRQSEIVFVLILTFSVFFVSYKLKKIKSKHGWILEILNVFIVLLTIYAIYQFGIYQFEKNMFIAKIVSPSLAVIIGYLGSTGYTFLTERKKNVLIKSMFTQYVSGALVNQLLEDPDKLKLGGERKELTILFSDVANFTSFSENKSPEQVVNFMNDYLTGMTDIILAKEGTLDKYLGDAIMAFWGAPIPMENHAQNACESAVLMCRYLDNIRELHGESDEKILNIRVGINTGDVVVGNMGGEKRFDYTVMGDNVNLASRLEGANKEYGTRIMISEPTYEKIKDKFYCRRLDTIRVKGRTKPTSVFELLGFVNEPIAEEKMEKLQYFLLGLDEYMKGNFEMALTYFDSSIQNNPEDRPSWTYFDRCQYYLDNPPNSDWDGVFELKTK